MLGLDLPLADCFAHKDVIQLFTILVENERVPLDRTDVGENVGFKEEIVECGED